MPLARYSSVSYPPIFDQGRAPSEISVEADLPVSVLKWHDEIKRRGAEVDDAAARVGTSVIDAHSDAILVAAGLEPLWQNADFSPERQ